MTSSQTADRHKLRKDKVKRAVALAMQSRWSEAEEANLSILGDFPEDLETYNRLGKALTELGRYREAKSAFQRVLEMSPHNAIARKNLDRLNQLGDDAPSRKVVNRATPRVFIEESGKAGVTSLINLASPKELLKMVPGHPVRIYSESGGLKVASSDGEYLGQVEPRLASRLTRLMVGGNRYEATVTSAGERELTVIVREVFQDPSQAGTASFPSRGAADYRVYLPGTALGYELGDEDGQEVDLSVLKDWSDDDTEPGDDAAFSPVVHRIINTEDEGSQRKDDF